MAVKFWRGLASSDGNCQFFISHFSLIRCNATRRDHFLVRPKPLLQSISRGNIARPKISPLIDRTSKSVELGAHGLSPAPCSWDNGGADNLVKEAYGRLGCVAPWPKPSPILPPSPVCAARGSRAGVSHQQGNGSGPQEPSAHLKSKMAFHRFGDSPAGGLGKRRGKWIWTT